MGWMVCACPRGWCRSLGDLLAGAGAFLVLGSPRLGHLAIFLWFSSPGFAPPATSVPVRGILYHRCGSRVGASGAACLHAYRPASERHGPQEVRTCGVASPSGLGGGQAPVISRRWVCIPCWVSTARKVGSWAESADHRCVLPEPKGRGPPGHDTARHHTTTSNARRPG